VSVDDAEKMKIQFGVTGENAQVVSGVDQTFRNTIIRDLARAIQEYEKKSQSKMNQVILIGGMSHMKGMARYVKQCLVAEHDALKGVEVLIGQPSSSIVVRSDFTDAFRSKIWQDISLALGIALK